MDELSYLSRPPRRTHSKLLGDLHALNGQFMDLIIRNETLADHAGFDACTQQTLQGLDRRERERITTCPYSLFDLAFADASLWRIALDDAAARIGVDDTPSQADAFALAALLYARQLCQHHDDMARLLLGMTEDVARLLATPDLTTLTHCAMHGRPPLRARLVEHVHFWPDIIDFARDGTRERRLAAHTLGIQHSAAKFP